jgi:putative transposase
MTRGSVYFFSGEVQPPRAPNQHWAGDITYLKANSRYRYLAVVIDLYSRKGVGWSLSDRRTVALTLRAMKARHCEV